MSYWDTLDKERAIQAVQTCGGDLSVRTLRTLGLSSNEAVTLGQVLESLGAVERVGPRRCRVLAWAAIDVVAALEGMRDYIERPSVEAEPEGDYTVVHDPHGLLPVGETFTRAYMQSLLTSQFDAADGLEVEADGRRYRLYQGVLYTLTANGRMISPG